MRESAFILMLAGVLANYALAQVTQPASTPSTAQTQTQAPATSRTATAPDDPLAASREIEAQLDKLADCPIARKLVDTQGKMRAISDKAQNMNMILEKHYGGLYDQLEKLYNNLCQSEEGQIYEKKRYDLESLLNNTLENEHAGIARAARNIYAARYEELQKNAVQQVPNLTKLGFNVLNYPRIDGSTSTHPLSVIIACRTFGIPYEWMFDEPSGNPYSDRSPLPGRRYVGIGAIAHRNQMDTDFNLAASQVVAKSTLPSQERAVIIINNLLGVNANTHVAYENLINGKCDLNLTARPPSEDELKLAKEKGVKIALKPIARDALVFIVHRKNGVNNLTQQQLVDIYDGKITRWTKLGWNPAEADADKVISPLRRERNSGSRELFDSLVMKGRQLPEDNPYAKSMFSASMSGPFNRVTVEPEALGYTVYYYEHFMAASPFTQTVAIDGVTPTAETIASGKYPFIADVYVAYRDGEPADSPAMKMLNWLLSEEGRAVIRESGYVPVPK